jgi:hypothetical protein
MFMASVNPSEASQTVQQSIPPLEPGDKLTREEFERRYHAMPNVKKAERIEGVVFMPSPVRQRRHSRPNNWLIGWLFAYEAATPGVESGGNATVRLDLDNDEQPDALLLIDPAHGGHARLSADDYIEHAPELVGEIFASSVSYDLHTKLHVYRRNGVREYIVWRVLDQRIDWFELVAGEYQPVAPDADGILRSRVFSGLWLDPAALLRGELLRVLAVVQEGIASPEHADFVKKLQAAQSQS